jgi:adenylosuccinate synthase
MPTELFDGVGETIREVGGEYGTTTGRARRVGWLDLPAIKWAASLNGITHCALTMLDVLSSVDEVKICTGYEVDGEPFDGTRCTRPTSITPARSTRRCRDGARTSRGAGCGWTCPRPRGTLSGSWRPRWGHPCA